MNVIGTKLRSRAQAERWIAWALAKIGPALDEGRAVMCEFFDGKTRERERLAHSCYRDLARDCLFNGLKASELDWKCALKRAFYNATKNDPEFAADWERRKPRMIPALDGDGWIETEIESRGFTKNLYRAYITFIHATGDERGVRWSPTSLGREWSELIEC